MRTFGLMPKFLAESCQGDRTQGQQSFPRIAKSTVAVHLVWNDIYIATERGGQIRAGVYYLLRAPAQKGDSESAMDRYANIITTFPRMKKTAKPIPFSRSV